MLRHCFLYPAIPADNPFLQKRQKKDQSYCEGNKSLLKSSHDLKYGHSLTTLFSSKNKNKPQKPNQPTKQTKKKVKRSLLWFLWGYGLYAIWIYSLVLWIAAPLIYAFIILFYNASHTEKPVMICPY